MLYLFLKLNFWVDLSIILLCFLVLPVVISLCYERHFQVGNIFLAYSLGLYAVSTFITFIISMVFKTLDNQGLIIIYVISLFINIFLIRLAGPSLKNKIRKFNPYITKNRKTLLVSLFSIINAIFAVEFAFLLILNF